ncbi:MAG: alkaline shock response membrane anchor protein AmaP [Coprobacillus sp.]|nr:alkaline shock response membrane anchor protein AmaP [Coprobacillus sp.]
MRTKLKLTVYRIFFFTFSALMTIAFIAFIIAKIMKAWGMSEDNSENNMITYIAFGVLAVFGLCQSIIVCASFWNGTMLMDSLCFSDRTKRINWLAFWITLGLLIVSIGLWLFAFFWKWYNLGSMVWELCYIILSMLGMIIVDCAFILIYMATFRRDFLVGNIRTNISRKS